MNILTMGVSGSGKSTIGKKIAEHFDLPFIEGDDYHPAANVTKMKAGKPLNDEDRQPWLEALGEVLAKAEGPRENGAETQKRAVLGSSALKEAYRDTLRKPLKGELHIIFLDGSREVLLDRLQSRKDHFFPPHLLDSQLETLEPPQDAIRIDIDQSIEEIVAEAVAALSGN
jgi:carbohydrate kinase (thermoresistant glucokinase family)